MKKLLLSILISFTGASISAQSLVVEEMDTVLEVNSTMAADYGFHIKVKNITSSSVDIKVARAWSSPNCAFDSAYFCWDYCYDNVTDTSIGSVSIASNAVSNDFSGHVYSPNSSATCTDSTRYVFFIDEGKNTSDTLSVWVYISAGPTMGTVQVQVEEAKLYPNPAKNYFTIESYKSGTLVVYNTVGTKVMQRPVYPGKNAVPTQGLSNGVYLYSLNGKDFKRLVINK
ncbi:MAG: Secretion system C-terminal sorting domain [Bacteroidota bacterium]|jgi:hypothetical protein